MSKLATVGDIYSYAGQEFTNDALGKGEKYYPPLSSIEYLRDSVGVPIDVSNEDGRYTETQLVKTSDLIITPSIPFTYIIGFVDNSVSAHIRFNPTLSDESNIRMNILNFRFESVNCNYPNQLFFPVTSSAYAVSGSVDFQCRVSDIEAAILEEVEASLYFYGNAYDETAQDYLDITGAQVLLQINGSQQEYIDVEWGNEAANTSDTFIIEPYTEFLFDGSDSMVLSVLLKTG